MGINGKTETASSMSVQKTRKESLRNGLRLLLMLFISFTISQFSKAAEIGLGDVYKGIGNTYGIETQSISISAATKVVGTNFSFVSLDPTQATFTGNNVPGYLTYKDANGALVQIRGVVSRPEKTGNTDRAVYFYTSDANDQPLGEAYLLVFVGYESVFPGTGTIATSSDPVDQSLNSQIKAVPTILVSVSALSGFSTCAGQASAPQTFTVSGTNLTAGIVLTAPAGYEISLSSASGYSSSITIALATGSTSIAATTVYVRLTSSAVNGASGDITATSSGATSKTITLSTATVNPKPTATAGSNSPICTGSTLNLTSSGGSTYAWSGPNGFSSTAQNPSISNAPTAASGTYSVTVTSAAGCSSTATTSVTVNSSVSATASAASNSVCSGGNISLSASAGNTYSWSGPNGFSSTVQSPVISNATVAASGTYTVLVSSGAGCSGSASVNVTVNSTPTVTGTLSACSAGSTSQLTGSGTPAAANAWVSSNTSIVTVSATGLITTVGSGTAQITYTNSVGCTATVTFTSTQTPAAPSAISGETAVVPSRNYTYSVSQVAGANSYNWLFPAGWAGSSTTNNISLIAGSTEGTISVTASANGCTSAPTSINVTVASFIADVITPNGDGFNDKWFVIVPASKRASVLIFNRWGQQVYKNEDYKSDWNGTGSVNFPNNILPNGTYLYVVELIDRASSAREIKKGTLTLRR